MWARKAFGPGREETGGRSWLARGPASTTTGPWESGQEVSPQLQSLPGVLYPETLQERDYLATRVQRPAQRGWRNMFSIPATAKRSETRGGQEGSGYSGCQ